METSKGASTVPRFLLKRIHRQFGPDVSLERGDDDFFFVLVRGKVARYEVRGTVQRRGRRWIVTTT